MNTLEIEKSIRSLFNTILENVTNEELKTLIKTKTFLTGGCFKALYHGQTVNDYDFYFVDETAKDQFIKIIDVGLCQPVPFTNREHLRIFDLQHKSEFALSFKLGDKKIQFITKYTGMPETVTNNFDFEHTKNYYVPAFDCFKINQEVLEKKQLLFNEKASHPVNALKRMQKFIKEGWTIDDPEIMKIAETISKLNLKDDKVYKEQASGMYLYKESKMRGYNSRRNIG